MPQQVRNPKRADSDLLARLSKRYGHIVLAAIEAGKAGIRKGALKARLIEYYHQLDGEWSREREKADWKGHDLATLKYETTRLLVAVLARNAPVGSQDLYHEIAEINWAIEHEAFNVALNISRTAQALAVAREEYGILHELLECEERILERLDRDDLLADHLKDCTDRQQACFIQLKYTHECAQIRKRICDPIKKLREAGDLVPKPMLEQLQQALEGIDRKQLQGTAATVDYFSACILCDLLLSDLDAAVVDTESLLTAYDATPWYAEKHLSRYTSQLRAASMLFSMTGRYTAAEHIILRFHRPNKGNQTVNLELRFSLVLCTVFHSYYAKQKTFSAKVIRDFLESEDEFEKNLIDKDWLRLNWISMVWCLHFDEMKSAYRLGKRIIARKTIAKKNILVAARIALYACETLLFGDDEVLLNYSYTATDYYLKRNGSEYPNARTILKMIRTFWLQSKAETKSRTVQAATKKVHSFTLTDSNGNAYYDFGPLLRKILVIDLNVIDDDVDSNPST
jgi:hypothetical protein